jgi:nucleotide sugar dehydrogenase
MLQLSRLIDNKKAKIAVVGMGYVGLPMAMEFVKNGYFVYGLDSDRNRISRLTKGISYITDVSSAEVKSATSSKRFLPTTDELILKLCDIAIICVPTPLRKRKVPNISYIIKATQSIARYLHKGQLIILESTTYPGTTRDVVLPILERSGLREGKDFFLVFSPERIDPGNELYPFAKIPKVVGGISSLSTKLGAKLYSKVVKKAVAVSSTEAAEVVKLLENTFRIVNIGLINEFAMLCDKLKINVWEIVEAAKTKPFGFMPFYPGPGIGGHCLAGRETIFIKNGNGVETIPIGSFIDKMKENPLSFRKSVNGILYIKPPADYKMLTFNAATKKSQFDNITMLSQSRADSLYKIVTNDNRKVQVTDLHPMLVKCNGSLKVKFAKDLKIGERIPFTSAIEYERLRPNDRKLYIDLLEELKDRPEFSDKIRIKPRNFLWKKYKDSIYKLQFDTPYYTDYVRYNSLPLRYYLDAERKGLLSLNHKDMLLCTGRGPSYNEIPAVIKVNSDFCRLLGYYLSEGCITKDRSLRTRFSFNINETEYLDDVCQILANLGVKYSTYKSRRWKSFYIKVSSDIFGVLLRDILNCGTDCYSMSIPTALFNTPKTYKWELLKGLLRGDGGVDIKSGKNRYSKNGKEYLHHCNSCGINYFSSSSKLFQQVVLLLQEFGIFPTFKKREGLLYIFGYKQILKLKDVFLGEKRTKVESYFKNNRKIIRNSSFQRYKGFITSAIKDIVRTKGDYVYSAEVKNTHTIVTSYGAIVHNCIPKDPLYLSWKARNIGFRTKMIDLASKTNLFMPTFAAVKATGILKKIGKSISRAKVLILGVTYKRDVKDLREAPALDLIEALKKLKAKVSYSDPYVDYLNLHNIRLKGLKLTRENIRGHDLLILVTDHKMFDYRFIAKNAKLIFDTRNAFGKRNIIKENIIKL